MIGTGQRLAITLVHDERCRELRPDKRFVMRGGPSVGIG
jgi:hypothetical protein